MPIWMRRNYLQLVNEAVKEQNKEQKAQQASHDYATQNQQQNQNRTNIQRPDIKSGKINSNRDIMVKPNIRTR